MKGKLFFAWNNTQSLVQASYRLTSDVADVKIPNRDHHSSQLFFSLSLITAFLLHRTGQFELFQLHMLGREKEVCSHAYSLLQLEREPEGTSSGVGRHN